MIEIALAWLTEYWITAATGTAGTFLVGWILKKIPTDRFAVWAKEVGEKQGKAITKYFNKKIPALWNELFEPIVIDTLNAAGIGWLSGFIAGLKSDNPEE